jgi:hypothetical protein
VAIQLMLEEFAKAEEFVAKEIFMVAWPTVV